MKRLTALAVFLSAACAPPPTRLDPYVDGPSTPPLHRIEIERLAKAGLPEDLILDLAEKRGVRRLSADDIVALKQAGVGDDAIRKMIRAERPDLPVFPVQGVGEAFPSSDPFYFNIHTAPYYPAGAWIGSTYYHESFRGWP